MHCYRFHESGFKINPVVLPFSTMQVLVENSMYVSQDVLPMSGGYAAYQWIWAWCLSLPHGLISQYEPRLTHSEASLQIYQLQRAAVSSPWQV